MSDSNSNDKTLWVNCENCGRQSRKHEILHQEIKCFHDEPYWGAVERIEYHRFVRCMGCESFKYVKSWRDPQAFDPYEQEERDFEIYPGSVGTDRNRTAKITMEDYRSPTGDALVPKNVWKMYQETLAALNHNIATLAAGGLRATVEAICLDRGITDGGAAEKNR